MPPDRLDRLLSELEGCRYRFGPNEAARVVKLLNSLDATGFSDARSLIRFHEALMFLRAFPQGPSVLRKTEYLLNNFWRKLGALRETGADMSDFDPLEVSGIAGTHMSDTLSFDVARWLVGRWTEDGRPTGVSDPHKWRTGESAPHVEIDWEEWDEGRAMATTLPRFMPLLEDDAYVEADTPWRRWMEAARGKKKSAKWLIERFERLPISDREKAELYGSLRVPLRWNLGNSRLTRTRNWETGTDAASRVSTAGFIQGVFYHDAPLISRSEVSLAVELAKAPPIVTRLSRMQGERVMDKIREVMLVRYRELYGTTLGDAASVVRAEVGRGVSIYLWNLPPERRLPLRAYAAGFTWKNGVPINYIEAIALCEWMEVGFNTFYTFRGGEVGWIYAQVLRCLCHLMGTTCISVYPYQLGHENEEAIESGAFWFYRKLGFRPGRADLLRLVEREEQKVAASRAKTLTSRGTATARETERHGGFRERTSEYRTPARTLRRLATGHVFYELPGSEVGAWDKFSTRNLGLRVNARMARAFAGDSRRMRAEAARAAAQILGANLSSWTALERTSFENFAVVLALVPDLPSWRREEKDALVKIIRSKTARDEMRYLHLMQKHDRLRQAVLKLGS
jgi:hypothetical protein